MGSFRPSVVSRDESAFLYVSELSPGVGQDAVDDIARASRERNRASAITGLLMFDGACFAQWVEGPTQAMDDLLARLRADPRHRQMDMLWFESPGLGRRYPQWHFGYLDLPRGSQTLCRLRGTRGADAMLLFGELGRGLLTSQRLAAARRPIGTPLLRVACESGVPLTSPAAAGSPVLGHQPSSSRSGR